MSRKHQGPFPQSEEILAIVKEICLYVLPELICINNIAYFTPVLLKIIDYLLNLINWILDEANFEMRN